MKIALIGFGHWGPNYARVLHDLPGVELTAVCDRRADRLAQIRERYPAVDAVASVAHVLNRPDIEAVVVATPASTQSDIVRVALEPYVLLKTIRLGYRHCEVPVTKIYPKHELGYTKMRPFVDWWSILKPVVYLGLGLRK